MDELEYALEWLRFAENDLGNGEYLLDRKPLPVELICFLCQQSAEKGLKGLLVLGKIIPPKTHDLEKLYALCEPAAQNIKTIWSQCNVLNQYSVQPRYPHEENITQEDADEAIKSARTILAFVKKFYPKQ
jgi:HEPN domain-containing protein